MVTSLARLILIVCFALPALADPGAAGVEKALREGLKVPADVPIGYADADGTPMTPDQFAARMQQGSVSVIADTTLDPGRTTFRLQAPEPAQPEGAPSHLPALDAVTLDGRRYRNSDLAGRPALVSFFFSTCVPCIQEVPALNAFRRKHPDMNVLAVTFDGADDARGFVRQRKLDWPVIADAQAFVESVVVSGYPAYLLVAPDGRIVARHTGLQLEGKEAIPGLASLEKWVAEASKPVR